MARDLGGYTTLADRKRARGSAMTSAAVLFAAAAAVTLRLGRHELFLAAGALALLVYFIHQRIAMARTPRGVIDLEDDAQEGVVLVLRRRGVGTRIPLARARMVGRTRTLTTVGPVRLQIEVTWDDKSMVATLAVPFRGGEGDVEGVLPTNVDLDRTASRALDALSYELSASAKDAAREHAQRPDEPAT